MVSLTLKFQISHQNQNIEKPHTLLLSFATRPLTFKLLQEVLKFGDICVT